MKTKFVTKFVTVFALFAMLFNAGCASVGPAISNGEVVGLQPGTALLIVKEAANGIGSSFTMVKTFADGSQGYIFCKPFVDMWGFVMASGKSEDMARLFAGGSGGNAANAKTFTEFMESAVANGWSRIRADQVPMWLKTLSAWAVSANNTFLYAQRVVATAGQTAAQVESTFFIVVSPSAFGSFGDQFNPPQVDN